MINKTNRLKRLPEYFFYEFDKLKEEAKKAGKKIYDFGVGDPVELPPKKVRDILKESIEKVEYNRYPTYKGSDEYLEAVANWYLKKFNINLNYKEEVLSLIGSKEGIAHAIQGLVEKGDLVLLTNPYFSPYTNQVLLADADYYFLNIDESNNYKPKLKDIPSNLWDKIKLFLLNFPNNPTSAIADAQFLEELIWYAKNKEFYILYDNAYIDIYYNKRPYTILEFKGAKDVAVEFISLSKTYNMSGWRIGAVSGNKDLINSILEVKKNIDSGVFIPVQKAAIWALENEDGFVKKQRDIYKKRRDTILQILDKLNYKYKYPEATIYIWSKIPENYTSSMQFSMDLFKETGILVAPGIGFGKNGEGYFRISLTVKDEIIKESLPIFEKFTKNLQKLEKI